MSADPGQQVAFRGADRYVARLSVQGSLPSISATAFSSDHSYLITGGLGELGLRTARWMVESGARFIILLARRPLPPRDTWRSIRAGTRVSTQVEAVQTLERLGARVLVTTADVGDRVQVGRSLQEVAQLGYPRIRGVVHAAGAVRPRLAEQVDERELAQAMHAKALGAWWLHRHLEAEQLDFFVTYSSAAALLSSPWLATYAAANAFLDALAFVRAAAGLPGLSVNWGPWASIGMAARHGDRRIPRGMRELSPEQALQSLSALLASGLHQAAVMTVDWDEWFRFHPSSGQSGFLVPQSTTDASEIRPVLVELDRTALLGLAEPERRRSIEHALQSKVAGVLGYSLVALEPSQSLSNLGLDSLMAVEIKNWIEIQLGVAVSLASFLGGTSIQALAAEISELLSGGANPLARDRVKRHGGADSGTQNGAVTADEAELLLARVQDLSEADIDLLLKRLAQTTEG